MRRALLLLLFLLQPLCAVPYPRTPDQTAALVEILEKFGLQDKSETWDLWVQQCKERWEYEGRYEERRDELWPLLSRAGLVEAILPGEKDYDYLLIFGALLGRVEQRWRFACKLWEEGVRFKTIVFLSGTRDLQPSERERLGENHSSIQSESDLMEWVYRKSPPPPGMESIPVVFTNAPAQPGAKRATTRDTIREWLSEKPIPGKCLAISNQPYVEYQQAVTVRLLPEDFSLEAVGPPIDGTPSVAILLDTLGRLLHEI